jgi:hypothetical protein
MNGTISSSIVVKEVEWGDESIKET